MPVKNIIKILKSYQKLSVSKQDLYLNSFQEKMIYRTTKTENPETTLGMVRSVLRKYK